MNKKLLAIPTKSHGNSHWLKKVMESGVNVGGKIGGIAQRTLLNKKMRNEQSSRLSEYEMK